MKVFNFKQQTIMYKTNPYVEDPIIYMHEYS